jgi:hypothetical protein
MSNLEDLKRIVLNDNFEDEDRKNVLEIEEKLHKALVAEKLADHEIIQEFITYLKERKDKVELLLKSDRNLSERERDKCFERIDVCDHFLEMLTGKTREDLENHIKFLLDAAKNL